MYFQCSLSRKIYTGYTLDQKVDELYVPRKCSGTNQLINAKDHASVQINVALLDSNGVYRSDFTTFAFSGFLRAKGESDATLNRLACEKNLMRDLNSFPSADKFKTEKPKNEDNY